MKILFQDQNIVVCMKPAGVVSTEEPGGMVDLIKEALPQVKQVYVIHRLDKEVAGVMVYALNPQAAAFLNKQIEEKTFEKRYLAVVSGKPEEKSGRFDDLLLRIQAKNKTYVVDRMRKGVRDAALKYEVLSETDKTSLVKIQLLTGRTHQIRVQFSSRKMPLIGDKKYGSTVECNKIALFSCMLSFVDPTSKKPVTFSAVPPMEYPWEEYQTIFN